LKYGLVFYVTNVVALPKLQQMFPKLQQTPLA